MQLPGHLDGGGGGEADEEEHQADEVRRAVVEHRVERESLKAVLQHPAAATSWYEIVEDDAYTFAPYRRAHQAVIAVFDKHDPAEIETSAWIESVMSHAADDSVRTTLSALVVEPLNSTVNESIDRYVTGVIAKLQELDASRRIADLKGRLQRLDAEADAEAQAEIFDQLLALETHRRALADHARGQG